MVSRPQAEVKKLYLSRMESSAPLPSGDPGIINAITAMRMPFGKYKGRILCDLPVEYLEWFARKGFPAGKIGVLLSTVHEIKLNGLDYLLEPLRKS